MRYFRSPELTFWAVCVLALAALTAFAASAGRAAHSTGAASVRVAAPGPATSATRTQVDALLALMPTGVAAGTNGTAVARWAGAVSDQAGIGTDVRRGEGAGDGDVLLGGFARVGADAASLRAHAADPVAATALRTQVGLDVDHLHRLVMGEPAPDLPAAGLDPFAGPDAPSAPSAPRPAQPGAPTLPEKK